jgi:hypothetical protein
MSLRQVISEAAAGRQEVLLEALRRNFRGRFLAEGDDVVWDPPKGLGDYTLERIQAFARGFLMGWKASAIGRLPGE